MDGEIKIARKGPVATLTISRSDKLNSVTREMLTAFDNKVNQLTNDPEIMVVIFTGEGEKAFSAGFDLKTVTNLKGDDRTSFFKLLESTIRCIKENRNCITVAAINGYAIGFGAMIVSACDFRFFSEKAAFRLPEVQLAIFPGAGATANLMDLVGPARTKDILVTGRLVSAEEALQIGLANRVVPHDELMSRVEEFVQDIIEKDRRIVMRTVNLVDMMTGQDHAEAADLETMYTDEWLRELEEND